MRIKFTVIGKPQPAGSKRGFGYKRKDGTVGSRVVDANPDAVEWKNAVSIAAANERNGAGLLEGPLRVRMTFFSVRPKGHYRTGRHAGKLKPNAPKYPTTRPDALKLARGTEDAMTGVLWRDDSQTVDLTSRKRYAEMVGAEIEVEAIE